MASLIILSVTYIIAALILLTISYGVSKADNEGKKYLALCMLGCAVTDISYMLSVVSKSYFLASLFSSIYFCSVDLILLFYLRYIIYYTGNTSYKLYNALRPFIIFYAFLDSFFLLINPFYEITMHFTEMEILPGHYEYAQPYHALYVLHLVYTYALVAMVIFVLVRKLAAVPKVYWKKYTLVIIGLAVIVFINAVFLYMRSLNLLDYSILLYGILGILSYYNEYHYSEKNLLNKTRNLVFDEMSMPIILFDNENKYAVSNKLLKDMIGEDDRLEYNTLEEFIKLLHADIFFEKINENTSFTCFPDSKDSSASYRCDYRVLRDKHSEIVGKFFVFSKEEEYVDFLTGFDTKQGFKRHYGAENDELAYPVSTAVFNINRLRKINEQYGHNTGDKAILLLSSFMRADCPRDAYFARLSDANLAVVCENTNSQSMHMLIDHITRRVSEDNSLGFSITVQAAVCSAGGEYRTVYEAARSAEYSLELIKLMDFNSEASSFLNSLIQIQQENDSDTSAHVRRTYLMGKRLGMRLGLQDSDIGSLSLLCILHDIGKIGIPYEVLNKPGRLNEREWELMRTHVFKGYRIAKSTNYLSGIADFILHHHESWDGSGYPDGLKGEEIPVLSRIIALVDAYDAMTNDRVYRKAISKAEARQEIRRMSGVQFDPVITEEFLKLLQEIDPLTEPVFDFEMEDAAEYRELEMYNNAEAEKRITPLTYCKYYLDKDFMIILIDKKFTEMTGYTQEDIDKGVNQMDLIFPEDRNYYLSLVNSGDKSSQEAFIRHRILCKDGGVITVNCHGKLFYDPVKNIMASEVVMIYAEE